MKPVTYLSLIGLLTFGVACSGQNKEVKQTKQATKNFTSLRKKPIFLPLTL